MLPLSQGKLLDANWFYAAKQVGLWQRPAITLGILRPWEEDCLWADLGL